MRNPGKAYGDPKVFLPAPTGYVGEWLGGLFFVRSFSFPGLFLLFWVGRLNRYSVYEKNLWRENYYSTRFDVQCSPAA
ncbi:MAG: hypothetical protein CSA33_07475 [Desulfobulbus propionicus]|nr:MAG: hypothetical protein CSA33_07475 [Desulfobulbus propionicus]